MFMAGQWVKCCQFSTIFRPDAGTLDDNRACFCVTWLFLKIFETSIYKWLLQLDDYKSLHRKWLFDQTSIVPGHIRIINIYIYTWNFLWTRIFVFLGESVFWWYDVSKRSSDEFPCLRKGCKTALDEKNSLGRNIQERTL